MSPHITTAAWEGGGGHMAELSYLAGLPGPGDLLCTSAAVAKVLFLLPPLHFLLQLACQGLHLHLRLKGAKGG